jgi:hypothetical protein
MITAAQTLRLKLKNVVGGLYTVETLYADGIASAARRADILLVVE